MRIIKLSIKTAGESLTGKQTPRSSFIYNGNLTFTKHGFTYSTSGDQGHTDYFLQIIKSSLNYSQRFEKCSSESVHLFETIKKYI